MTGRTTRMLGLEVALGLALLSGCGSSHTTGDGGGGGDDGGVITDDGGGGTVCGDTVCGPGELCCPGCGGESGICAVGGCPDILCLEWTSCEDALVGGGNEGDACTFTDGCGAAGGCCDRRVQCVDGRLEVEEACLPDCFPTGSCESNADCAASEYCDFPEGTCAGIGLCTLRPGACYADCPGVCGCDGNFHCNACGAAANGIDVGPDTCTPPASCDPQDARGVGDCRAIIGIFWNGMACVTYSGCSCAGADCGAGYRTLEACERAHRSCFDDCRTTGCPAGQTCEPCWATYACLPPGAIC